MSEVARARAAVDAHVGVLGVAEAWLYFLWNVSVEDSNMVRCLMWDGWCLGLFGIATAAWTGGAYSAWWILVLCAWSLCRWRLCRRWPGLGPPWMLMSGWRG